MSSSISSRRGAVRSSPVLVFLGLLGAAGAVEGVAGEPPASGLRDFRIPWTPCTFVLPGEDLDGSPQTLLHKKYGPKPAVYWDKGLGTPRYVAFWNELRLVGPEATDAELVSAVKGFVAENSEFFGVGVEDLLDGIVTPVAKMRLVAFGQGFVGVTVRGAGLRALIDQEGELLSVDAFILRTAALPPISTVVPLDANAILANVLRILSEDPKSGTGLTPGPIDLQVIFPTDRISDARLGWCVQAEGAAGDAWDLFLSTEGDLLGEDDPAHYAGGAGPFEGRFKVDGFSTDPEDIVSAANKASDFFPLEGARIFLESGARGLTSPSGDGVLSSESFDDVAWADLAFAEEDAEAERCPVTPADIEERKDGLKTIFSVFSRRDGVQDELVTLYDAKRMTRLDPLRPASLRFEVRQDPEVRLMAFDLLVYHQLRRMRQRSKATIGDSNLTRAVTDMYPIRVILMDSPISETAPKYMPAGGTRCNPFIILGQKRDRQTWITPTIVHHEYAHHLIDALVGTGQKDDFVEGIAVGLVALANEDGKLDLIDENRIEKLSLNLDEESHLTSTDMRRWAGAVFWRSFRAAREIDPPFMTRVKNLFYTWMASRRVAQSNQIAFDPNALLEQITMTAVAMDPRGKRTTSLPEVLKFVVPFFQGPKSHWYLNRFIRGDADHSGTLDLTDAVATLQYLFLGGEENRCLVAHDTDDSTIIDITDPVKLLIHLFLGGEPPPAPYPECGFDGLPRDLWCTETSAACRP